MKTKLLYFVSGAFMALALSSCENQDVDLTTEEEKDNFIPYVVADYENIKPSNFIDVPVDSGYYAEVYFDGELICRTLESTVVEVPNVQYSNDTKSSSGVDIKYLPYDPKDNPMEIPTGMSGTNIRTLMFEDKIVGSDYDYNDLVITVSRIFVMNKRGCQICIQPIAMGNTQKLKLCADIYLKEIKLGSEIKKVSTIIFSEDVKRDLFGINEKMTFINTCESDPDINVDNKIIGKHYSINPKSIINHFDYYNVTFKEEFLAANRRCIGYLDYDIEYGRSYQLAINWFIINEYGDKIYAIPSIDQKNVNWRDDKGYPYGLSIFNIDERREYEDPDYTYPWAIDYPRERENISKVYPNFSKWIIGEVSTAGWGVPDERYSYPAINNFCYEVLQSPAYQYLDLSGK